MNQALFFENFELLANSPNGVQKLRELILQLAVMGKLVPQDPNDEPASILLEKIRDDKPKQTKNIESNFFLPVEIEDEPFEIPATWEWIRVGEIVETIRGVSYKKQDSSEEPLPNYLPILRANNINGSINFHNLIYVPEKLIDKQKMMKAWDILIAMSSGSKNLVGKAAQLSEDFGGSFGAFCGLIRPSAVIYRRYTGCYFQSPYYRETISSFGKGIGINNLRKDYIENLLFPIPPLAEQKRIVSKVDELMILCDKLETRRQKKQEIQSKLNSAALKKMLSAENQEEFEQNWQRICENFDLLYDNPENVEKLKQAILKAGVEGRLTKQWRTNHPDVEPARSFLSEIKKNRKVSDIEKGKRSKQLKPFDDTELSELPESWEWTRLDTIADIKGGITKDSKRKVENGREVPYLRVANVQRGYLDLDEIKYIEASESVISELSLKYGDVLFTEGGDLDKLGRGWIWENELPECIHQNHIFRARLHSEKIISKFVSWFANSHYQYFMDEGKQTTNLASINLTKLRGFTLPLPPYEEQKIIVEKIEQLMDLCDELESKLRNERKNSEKLMEAAVKGLLEAAAA